MKVIKLNKPFYQCSNLEITKNFYNKLNISVSTIDENADILFKEESPWIVYLEELDHRINKGRKTPDIILEGSLDLSKNFRFLSFDPIKIYDPDNHIIEIKNENTN